MRDSPMTKKGIVFTIVGAIAAAGLAVGIPFAVTALSVPEGKMPDSVYKALEHDYPLRIRLVLRRLWKRARLFDI